MESGDGYSQRDEVTLYMARAHQALRATEHNLEDGFYITAVNRAYYSPISALPLPTCKLVYLLTCTLASSTRSATAAPPSSNTGSRASVSPSYQPISS